MNAQPLRVWLVDDDASIRYVMAEALQDAGYRARGFESAAAAMAELRPGAVPARRGRASSSVSLASGEPPRRRKAALAMMTQQGGNGCRKHPDFKRAAASARSSTRRRFRRVVPGRTAAIALAAAAARAERATLRRAATSLSALRNAPGSSRRDRRVRWLRDPRQQARAAPVAGRPTTRRPPRVRARAPPDLPAAAR